MILTFYAFEIMTVLSFHIDSIYKILVQYFFIGDDLTLKPQGFFPLKTYGKDNKS